MQHPFATVLGLSAEDNASDLSVVAKRTASFDHAMDLMFSVPTEACSHG